MTEKEAGYLNREPDRSVTLTSKGTLLAKTAIHETISCLPGTVLINFPLYCPICKQERIVTIVNLQLTLSQEQTH